MSDIFSKLTDSNSAVSQVGDTIFGVWNAFTKNWNKAERENALEDTKTTMDWQSAANKDLATFTQGLQKEMIEYTSPKMQMERYKDAGLNPALLYGMSGGAGQTTGSASAGGVNPHNTDAAARSIAKQQMLSFGLQLAKLKSEIDLNKSAAMQNEANAKATLTYKSKEAAAQTQNLVTLQELNKNLNNKVNEEINNLRKEGVLKDNMKDIQELEKRSLLLKNDFDLKNNAILIAKNIQETNGLLLNNKITESSMDSLIEVNRLQVKQMLVNMRYTKKLTDLTDKKIDEIVANVKLVNHKIEFDYVSLKQQWEEELLKAGGVITKDVKVATSIIVDTFKGNVNGAYFGKSSIWDKE